MPSSRLAPLQTTFKFIDEGEMASGASEPQRGQSAAADMRKTALNTVSESLIEQIVNERNMERAWKKVKANRGAPGPDGVTLDEFFHTFRAQWPTVRQQLLDGTYEPSPARRKSIPKPDGSERRLGIPNVQDRLIQQAILQVLTPKFDPGFSESSFGFRISPKNTKKFKDRIRAITRRKRGVSMSHRFQELRRYFQGWMGYFSLVPLRSIFSKLDKWVRRRIRSCYWKQWRHPRTRITKLRKLGIRARDAYTHGISSKGSWVMSKTEAMHFAITIDYLRNKGLVSLEELWNKFAPKWRIA